MIRWTENDVIAAINEALAPSQDGTGRTNLLGQLKVKAQEKETLPRRPPIVPKRFTYA